MVDIEINYQAGARAAMAVYNSPNYAWITKPMNPRDAMRLFLPPVNEMRMEMQMPLPQDRQDWMKGFEEEQAAIQEELTLESTET